MNQGEVGILNVGAGDTKIVFDPKNPQEMIRAARIVKDMLRRGYALLIEIEPGKFTRALDFDETKFEYIIADFDPMQAANADKLEVANGQTGKPKAAEADTAASPGTRGSGNGWRRGRRAIPASSTRSAVAVGRTAGG